MPFDLNCIEHSHLFATILPANGADNKILPLKLTATFEHTWNPVLLPNPSVLLEPLISKMYCMVLICGMRPEQQNTKK